MTGSYEDALRVHGKPEVFNSDQGSQFPASAQILLSFLCILPDFLERARGGGAGGRLGLWVGCLVVNKN